MDSRMRFVLLWTLLSYTSTAIKLDGNGYVDIIIAISSEVPEDDKLIDKIKEMVTEGSLYLYKALDKKVYFKEAAILVPPHWNSKTYSRARTESFEKGTIRIDHANPAYSDEPYTKQYGNCAAEGQYIHFTPNFLQNDTFVKMYGSRGRVLVHEWAHMRWGVYDEYSEETPLYLSTNGNVETTRCSKNITGQLYDVTTEPLQPCRNDDVTSLLTEGCKFFPSKNQTTSSSIMSFPSLDSVITFCRQHEHNYEAPNLQNEKCGKATWTVIFEDSVDKDALRSLKPLESAPPPPTFKVVQRMKRAVCLVLDVSGSMKGSRILRQQQAATYFLQNIIEDESSVGIVSFSTDASTLSPLTVIDKDSTRENLVKYLPKEAGGWTYMCKGLNLGLQVLKKDNQDVLGDEIIFLTDGEATDTLSDCVPAAINSGAIIHTVAFGDKADKALREMADKTGGKFITASDNISSNQLLNGFFAITISTGNQANDPIQIDSVGMETSDWFNGTVSVDQTIGSKTSFTITYGTNFPGVTIQSPSGLVYSQTQMHHDESAKTVTLKVPGTAEAGDWEYSIKSPALQSLTVTATSQAAHANVPPITVKAHMSQQFSDGSKPMIVYAEVIQNYNRIIEAEVWATLESESGSLHELQLLDNGGGADTFKDDGVYSRYFTQMKEGRSSLKVRVKNKNGKAKFALPKSGGAPYIPGYVVNGVVELNPPKPSVSQNLRKVGSFTRTVTGESFEVDLTGSTLMRYPPCKIMDLRAEILDDAVLLSWTAPGEDLDNGTAKSYDIRWSFDLKELLFDFNNSHVLNTSAVSPLECGSVERHLFNLSFPIQNDTILFFAVQSEDKEYMKSEMSNIASGTKIIPGPNQAAGMKTIPVSKPAAGTEIIPGPNPADPHFKLMLITISVCMASVVVIGILALTTWALRRNKLSDSYSVNLVLHD